MIKLVILGFYVKLRGVNQFNFFDGQWQVLRPFGFDEFIFTCVFVSKFVIFFELVSLILFNVFGEAFLLLDCRAVDGSLSFCGLFGVMAGIDAEGIVDIVSDDDSFVDGVREL